MSMYETLMSLPLFKGASSSQISVFLEKTSIEFLNYAPGDVVAAIGTVVDRIGFVISGAVKKTVPNFDSSFNISETCRKGVLIGGDNLFGMFNTYQADFLAVEDSSVMWISKEKVLRALVIDRLYMLNYLNYLSLQGQRPVDTLKHYGGGTLHAFLAMYVQAMTGLQSEDIEIQTNIAALSRLSNLTPDDIKQQLTHLSRQRLIEILPGRIRIPSRFSFLSC